MDTAKLRALLTAADIGSLSGAAAALGYTQSGLTHMMNALEEEAGVPLLARGNRGVRLTPDGERLLPAMRELVTCDERLEQELALTRGLERGRVRIGSFSSMSLRWLPRVLERFQTVCPAIEVELLEGNGAEIEAWLDEGRVDLAFTSLQPNFTYETIRIKEDPMLAVLPRSHPMAGAAVYPIQQLRGETFLVYTTNTEPDEDLARVMRLAGIPPRVRFSSNFDQTIISMVEHNLGVTVMPALILEGSSADVAAVPLSPPLSRTLGIALRPGARRAPALSRFLACALSLLLPGGGE